MFTHLVCSIWAIDRTLSGFTTLGQSRSGSNGNEWVLHILQISKVGTSPSYCLISYPGYLLVKRGYPFVQRCSWCILQPLKTGPILGWSCLCSHRANTFWEKVLIHLFSSSYRKIAGQAGSLALLSKWSRRKLLIQTSITLLRNWPCVTFNLSLMGRISPYFTAEENLNQKEIKP